METPIAQKRKRGNPNFQKGKKQAPALKGENNNNASTPAGAEPNKQIMNDTATATEEQVSPSAEEGKKLPDNLFSDTIGEEVKPMDGPVKEKAYASLPDQPEEKPNTFSSDQPATEKTDSASSSAPTTAAPAKTVLSPEETQTQAAQAADLMLQAYDKLHMLGRYIGKIDDEELMMMHNKGQIDLEFELPLGTQKIVTKDFFKGYNDGIDQTIVVSDEFKNDIRPPLVRMCVKHGWLMNDDLYVISKLTEDVATKVSMLFGLKKSCSLVLKACVEIMKAQKSNGSHKTEQTSFNQTPGPDGGNDESWREPVS